MLLLVELLTTGYSAEYHYVDSELLDPAQPFDSRILACIDADHSFFVSLQVAIPVRPFEEEITWPPCWPPAAAKLTLPRETKPDRFVRCKIRPSY